MASYSEFRGTFAYSKVYASSPNPCLNVRGLGEIGLPLSGRDATALRKLCEGASSDVSDQKTWDLDHAEASSLLNCAPAESKREG